jgi:hypothetical protein
MRLLPIDGLVIFAAAALAAIKPPSHLQRKPVSNAHVQTALPPTVPKNAVNLVKNGTFEAGTLTPTGWQTVDGLCSFWVKDTDPAHGKVLKFDTDVQQSQAYDWWVKIAGGASPKDAPKKLATVEPKYDTLAGNDGVWFWSDPFPLEPGKAYWLTVDAKGPGLLVWLVGYPKKPSTKFGADEAAFQEVLQEHKTGKPLDRKRGHKTFIHSYVWKGQMAAGGSDTWKTYSRRAKPFRPTAVTPDVRYGQILILPTWPPGVYFVDNIRLVAVKKGSG